MNYGPAIQAQAQAGEQLHDFPKPSSLDKTIQQVVEGQYTSCQKEDSYKPYYQEHDTGGIFINSMLQHPKKFFLIFACSGIMILGAAIGSTMCHRPKRHD